MIAGLWKALEERQQMLDNLDAQVVAPPVDLFINEITRNGIVRVKFNQNLNVPAFFTKNGTAK